MQAEVEESNGMRLIVEYNADLQSEQQVERIMGLLTRTLNTATSQLESRVSELHAAKSPSLAEADQGALERAANGRTLETDLFRPYSLLELIEGHAVRRPRLAAIIAGRRELSWENLIKRSLEYAAALKTRGVGKGSVVALRMESRLEAAICCVALLKLGAIVVPVPASADAHTWESVWNHVSPALAIAAKGFLRPGWETWNYEALAASYIRPADLQPVQPEDVACILLSSTADHALVPVPVDHQTAVKVARGAARKIRLAEGDPLQILPASASVEAWSDLIMGLCAGACTALYPGVDDLRSDLLALRSRGRYVAGSQADLLAAHSFAAQFAPATILCRDGRLSKAHYQAFRSRSMHGFALLYACALGGPAAVSGIGMETGEARLAPIAGSRFTLRDACGQWPQIEGEGELFVSMADGIRIGGRSNNAPQQLIASGWICRLGADDGLMVVASARRKTVVDGSRLRLEELEDALQSHEAVAEAVVVVHSDKGGHPTLHAYLIAQPNSVQKLVTIQEDLRKNLPEDLASAELHWVRAFPRRADGSVDEGRLASFVVADVPSEVVTAPVEKETEVEANVIVVPIQLAPAIEARPAAEVQMATQSLSSVDAQSTSEEYPGFERSDAIEATLADVWERVLGIPSISSNANFFELGSYRHLLPILFSSMNEALGTRLPPDAIYNAPTIAEIADIARGETRLTTLIPVNEIGTRETGTRLPLFVIHSSAIYESLVRMLGDEQPIYALRELKEDRFKTIEERAAYYASIISKAYGPYHLAGCEEVGPLVAETARQLRRMGEEVSEVNLFDSSLDESSVAAAGKIDSDGRGSLLFRSRPLLLNLSPMALPLSQ
jgi:hypothetical protein